MTLPDQILSNLTFALTKIHFSILQSRQRDKNANGRITLPVQYLKKKIMVLNYIYVDVNKFIKDTGIVSCIYNYTYNVAYKL